MRGALESASRLSSRRGDARTFEGGGICEYEYIGDNGAPCVSCRRKYVGDRARSPTRTTELVWAGEWGVD